MGAREPGRPADPAPRFNSTHPAAAMSLPPLVRHGEGLRRALAWLAEHGGWTAALIDEASLRFDLDPAEEEFLLRALRSMREAGAAGPPGAAGPG